MTQRDLSHVLENIAHSDDPAKLRRFMKNARRLGEDEVYDAAFQRLITVQPSAEVGTVAHDVWRTIYAFEELRREEAGTTILLSRTRQAIKNKGELRTVLDLVRKSTASAGFDILRERDKLELSLEALVIARAEHFPTDAVDKARARLEAVGMDLDRVHAYWRAP